MASSKPVSAGNPSTTVTEDTQEVNNETLRLKLKKDGEKKKIQWTEDTVDNEGDYHRDLEFVTFSSGLGKKKSKICCQYKKPRAHLDESSDDESDDCSGHSH